MDSIDTEFLNSLSLYDLNALKKFYNEFSPDYYWSDRPDVNDELCSEREQLIAAAIKQRLCSYDQKLFGTPVLNDQESFISGRQR